MEELKPSTIFDWLGGFRGLDGQRLTLRSGAYIMKLRLP